MWLRQVADTISAAVQSGTCPDGADRLKTLFEKLQKSDADKALAAYVRFRQLTAAYVLSMQAKKADYAKIQAEWLKTLEQYISDYPAAADAAEAMLQLAISQEFTGQDDDAKKWYVRIVNEFPNSAAAKKAAGAQTRLDAVGKSIVLRGQSPLGSPVDLAKYRGKVVLIQYWATWSAPAKADMATLKELWNKYGRSFVVIGVSLDNNVKDLNAYLAENPLPWPQIYEEGGLGQPAGQCLGHPHRADDDPGRSARQGRQPQHRHRGGGIGSEETGQIGRMAADESATDGCLVHDPGDCGCVGRPCPGRRGHGGRLTMARPTGCQA